VNVDEQRVRFVGRPATRPLPAASRRHFLIANLELKVNVSYIRINDLKFSNRKFSAILHCIFPSLKPPTPRSVVLKASGQDARHEGSQLRPHSILSPSAQVKPLIETPRLEIRITSRKTKSIPISNRDKSGTLCSRFIPSRSARRARVATSHASLRDHLPAFSASMLESKTT
jgi:hypothetical protein